MDNNIILLHQEASLFLNLSATWLGAVTLIPFSVSLSFGNIAGIMMAHIILSLFAFVVSLKITQQSAKQQKGMYATYH